MTYKSCLRNQQNLSWEEYSRDTSEEPQEPKKKKQKQKQKQKKNNPSNDEEILQNLLWLIHSK